jgi:hypothetical protein
MLYDSGRRVHDESGRTMKKILLLLVMASFGTFVLSGCGNTGGEVFGVNELVDTVTADQDGWIGKEVAVSGYVSHMSGSNGANGYFLTMINYRRDQSERYVICTVPHGVLPEGIATQTVEVKGKIGSVKTQNYLNQKRVTLDSCELKK